MYGISIVKFLLRDSLRTPLSDRDCEGGYDIYEAMQGQERGE